MNLKVHASGSAGNFYTIEDNGQILLIEAGIKMNDIKSALNYKFDNVVGCIVSHSHTDHSMSIKNLLDFGVTVVSSAHTMSNYDHHYAKVVTDDSRFKLGDYTVLAFDVEHDCPDSLGFVIITPSGKRILFATDTQFVPRKFKNIDVYMLECNYDRSSMLRAIKSGKLDEGVLLRVSDTHMSLETVLKYLDKVDLSKTQYIMLIHLSESNSLEKKYKKSVYDQTHIETLIADKGVEINYSSLEF